MAMRGWYWPWLLGTALLGIVAVNVTMLFVANSDANGSVVEPDYYRKAVQWDSTMAHRAASDRLRWTAAVSLSAGDRVPGQTARTATLRVTLADSAGTGATGAVVRAVLIHNADAARPIEVALRDRGDGRYVAELRLTQTGLWEVRLTAERGSERFSVVVRTDLVVQPAGR